MGQTRQKSRLTNKSKVSKRGTSQDLKQQRHCFITWTDWRAFQPARHQINDKQEDSASAICTHNIEGWHPEAFANRYRRASYPRLLPLPTKNLNILNSQRINSWERDFLSALLVSEKPPLLATGQGQSSPQNADAKPSEASESLEVPDKVDNEGTPTEVPSLHEQNTGSEPNCSLVSTPDFSFEKCLAEVEQIVCDSIKDLPNMFDGPENSEKNVID